jgi:hypothetical protein
MKETNEVHHRSTVRGAGSRARKLLEIVRAKEIAVGQYTYTGVTNSAFVAAGGSVEEYSAGRKYATAQRWFEIDSSGTRIILLQAGADNP